MHVPVQKKLNKILMPSREGGCPVSRHYAALGDYDNNLRAVITSDSLLVFKHLT